MEERLLKRGKSSGRADDNIETIKKRFVVFIEETLPIVKEMEKKPQFVITVNAEKPTEEVFADLKQKMINLGYKTI